MMLCMNKMFNLIFCQNYDQVGKSFAFHEYGVKQHNQRALSIAQGIISITSKYHNFIPCTAYVTYTSLDRISPSMMLSTPFGPKTPKSTCYPPKNTCDPANNRE